MSRRGKSGSQLGGGPGKRGGSSSSPPAPAPTPPPAPAPTPVAPPQVNSGSPPAAWWTGCGGSSSQGSSPHGNQSTNPWGGYLNMLQQPHIPAPLQPFGENFHFVGITQNLSPAYKPSPPLAKGTDNVTINIDGDDGVDVSRSVKKRYWTHEEEVRLASAWLNTSKDPIHGNDKKGDSFWGQNTEEFNKNCHPDRRRDTNQLKIHWSRLSKTINEFNGYWSSVSKMNKSGYSDDQLMDEAQQLFQKKHGKPFALVHWWKTLKNEPKWCTYIAQSEKEKAKSINVDVTTKANEERPMGREAAKAEQKGKKRKAEHILDGIVVLGENVNKILEVTQERKKEREKVTKSQLEISRMNLQAKFLEGYTSLLAQDTSQMSEEAKAGREKTLKRMEEKIFSMEDEA